VRLLCRAHNQYVAEQAFGVDHMSAMREAAARRRQGQQQAEQWPRPPCVKHT
jgi:hypothetical protein